MPRDIQDLHFKDTIYTEPQTLKRLSILDDVRRTLAYQMVFDGHRWVKQRPRVGGVEKQYAAQVAEQIGGNTVKTLFETPANRRGRILNLTFRTDHVEVRPYLYIDNISIPLYGENVWSMTNNIQSLHEKGDEDGIWKLTKYDTTNNEYALHLMRELDFNGHVKFEIYNMAGTAQIYEYDAIYTLIDDRIPGREK